MPWTTHLVYERMQRDQANVFRARCWRRGWATSTLDTGQERQR